MNYYCVLWSICVLCTFYSACLCLSLDMSVIFTSKLRTYVWINQPQTSMEGACNCTQKGTGWSETKTKVQILSLNWKIIQKSHLSQSQWTHYTAPVLCSCFHDETPILSNLLFLCHRLELWLSRAACRLSNGAAVGMKPDQSGSHNILQVTAPCRSLLDNSAWKITMCVISLPHYDKHKRYTAAWDTTLLHVAGQALQHAAFSSCNFAQKYICRALFW